MVDFLNLKKINAQYQDELKLACENVITSGWYIQGDKLDQFEKKFLDWTGARDCIGVGNGYDALRLTLRAWIELGRLEIGDEVVVQANTYIASVLAITDCGLVPVFADPCESSYNLKVKNIERAATARTRVIIPVHLYGQISPMKEICEWADSNDILILEDCAQAHGASVNDKKAGTWGDAGAFSFYPAKVLGALGDAGAVVTNDMSLSEVLRSLRNYGSSERYIHERVGVNSRLDEIQAAMLCVKLDYIDAEIAARRYVAEAYQKNIINPLVELPVCSKNEHHVWHLYVIKVEREIYYKSIYPKIILKR